MDATCVIRSGSGLNEGCAQIYRVSASSRAIACTARRANTYQLGKLHEGVGCYLSLLAFRCVNNCDNTHTRQARLYHRIVVAGALA